MTIKHIEAPFHSVIIDYHSKLIEAGKKHHHKIINVVVKQGYSKAFGERLIPICLWLSLGHKERLKLSQAIRKANINIYQVCINKLDSMLEENSFLEDLSNVKMPKDKFISARENLKYKMENFRNNTKAGHLKDLIMYFRIAILELSLNKIGQKEQTEFIYNLMKEFDFEWGIGYQVVEKKSKNCLVKFDGKYEAETYLKEIENSEKYYIEKTGLKVDDIPYAFDRIRVQIQQAVTNKLKPIIKEFDSIKSEV